MKIVPASALSRLTIDVDKDWNEKNIHNVHSGKINLGIDQPLSPGLIAEDIGKVWSDLGKITTGAAATAFINSLVYCGNGIVCFGAGNLKVYRSIDYGLNWTALTLTSSTYIYSIGYCGGGIILASDANGRVYRSTDYGLNWTDLGVIASGQTFSMTYCGNGIVLLSDINGHIFRSTNYGATWTGLGAIASSGIYTITYSSDGIVLCGDNTGHVFRSTNYGENWTDLGMVLGALARFRAISYCGNGIVLLGDFEKHISRSKDYGQTWTDLGIITVGSVRSMVYCGNGIALAGDNSGHVYRSTDFGETWTDLGSTSSGNVLAMAYCNNGVSIFGDSAGHVYLSDGAFRFGDASALDAVRPDLDALEDEIDCIVSHMDFWSDIDGLVTLPADTALQNIVVADIPSDATVIRAILILKYSSKEDTSGSDNQITAGTITSKETSAGTYVDAINLINGEAAVEASTKEGGDVHVGDNDVSGATSGITGNCTVQSVFSGVTTTGASIKLYDVQIGIRIYFT